MLSILKRGKIYGSFLLAWVLMILPLPHSIQCLRPEWMLLLLIYWTLFDQNKLTLFTAFFIGLLSDILNGSVLGQYAFTMTLVAYLTQIFKNRLRLFSFWQQSLLILVLVGIGQLSILSIQWSMGHPPPSLLFWCPSLTSTFVWMLFFRTFSLRGKKGSFT